MKAMDRNRLLSWLCGLALALGGVPVWAQSGGEEVGHVIAASGLLKARGGDGSERELKRRSPIYRADTLWVGDNGFLQLRFTDGALVSLRPGSELKVKEYRFEGKEDGSEKAVFDLVKGGLRTITGAIGRSNQENYQVETPVATIGIRGTHYGLRFCSHASAIELCGEEFADGLYGGVATGAVGVTNAGGDRTFGNDRYFYVRDANTAAVDWMGPLGIVFDPLGPGITRLEGDGALDNATGTAAKIDEVGLTGRAPQELTVEPVYQQPPILRDDEEPPEPTIKGQPAPQGSILLTAFKAHGADGTIRWVAGGVAQGNTPVTYIDTLNDRSGMVTHIEKGNLQGCTGNCTLDMGTATLQDAGNHTAVAASWGRWDGGWLVYEGGGKGEAYGSWHFLYADSTTPAADIEALGARNIVATFGLMGGTRPTDEGGNLGTYQEGFPTMEVNFGKGKITDYQVAVYFADTGRNYYGSLTAPTGIGAVHTGLDLDVSCAGCGESRGAPGAGHAEVAFVGSAAGYALNSWEMHSQDGAYAAVGGALLHQTSAYIYDIGQPAPSGSWAQTVALLGDGNGGYTGYQKAGSDYHLVNLTDRPNVVGAFAGDLERGGATLAEYGSVKTADLEATWGRWAGDWEAVSGVPTGSWHFIQSPSTTSSSDLSALQQREVLAYFDPVNGQATTPTDGAGNTGSYGFFTPRATVDFGSRTLVDYRVEVNIPSTSRSFAGDLAGSGVSFAQMRDHFDLQVTCSGCTATQGTGGANLNLIGSGASHAVTSFYMDAAGSGGSAIDRVMGTHLLYQASTTTPTTGGGVR